MRECLGLCFLLLIAFSHSPGAVKAHTVFLGTGKNVPYSSVGDPAGALPSEKQLHVRPLLVDDKLKEWTTGESTPSQIAASLSVVPFVSMTRFPGIRPSIGYGNVDPG